MVYSLEDQLFYSSLLCGLRSTGDPSYRLQLFFIANKELGSKSHQSDFQRALETGVDKNKYWLNYKDKGSGEYLFTQTGYNVAIRRFVEVKPIYTPVKGKDYHVLIKGIFRNILIEMETFGNNKNSTKIFIDNQSIKSAKEACKIIERKTNIQLPTTGDSAVRVLYNFAIDNDFDLIWKGSIT